MSDVFRIRKPKESRRSLTPSEKELRDARDTIPFDAYLGRLIKLIPGEVLALYLIGRGFIPENDGVVLAVWTIISTFAVIVVRANATKDLGKPQVVQWPAVIIATISFVIWVYSMGDVFSRYNLYIPYLGSLLVLTWTFFLPFVYRGD